MGKRIFVAFILAAPMAGAAAFAEDDGGGYVAPELSKPTDGQLLNQDLSDRDRRDRTAPWPLAVRRDDPAGPRHPAAGQQDRQQRLQRLLGLPRTSTSADTSADCLTTTYAIAGVYAWRADAHYKLIGRKSLRSRLVTVYPHNSVERMPLGGVGHGTIEF